MEHKIECQQCPVRNRRFQSKWTTVGQMLLYALRMKRLRQPIMFPCHRIALNARARRNSIPDPGDGNPMARQVGDDP